MATKRSIFSILVFFLMATAVAFAQKKITVTGTVNEPGMGPIPGATVIIQGTSIGCVTDFEGKYSLESPADGVLEFRFIGMETKVVPVGGKTVIDVDMESNTVAMDEVVVVGYGTQSRRTVTASISTVRADAIKDIPAASVDQALQGRATGISIINPSGEVGQAPIVRIRGVGSITSGTQPLYIVDGMPIQTGNLSYGGNVNALADINPSDILSMEVLKDAAAAAMYGSRAANGVILITTKKGSSEKTKVSYDGWFGVTTRSKFFDVMNAQEYVDFKNQAVRNRYGTDEMSLTEGYTSPYGNKAFNMWQLSDGSYVDSDWKSAAFQTGLQHNHTVSVQGGSEKTQFYLSGNYTDQKGMVKGDKYNRLGTNASVSSQATEWLKVGANVNASTSQTKYTDRSRKGGTFATEGFTRMAIINPPNVPIYNEDGTPYLGEGGYLGMSPNTVKNGYTNPAALLTYGSGVQSEITRILTSVFADISPVEGLTLRTQYGIDHSRVEDKIFNTAMMFGDTENGHAANYAAKSTQATWTNTATYTFSLGEHHFDILAGIESFEKKLDRWGAARDILLDDKYEVFQGPFATISADGNAISESSLLSYLGRVNYDYQARYMLSVNFRRDGYSALSKDHRWGNFGGASAAWRISSEKFFEPLSKVITDLKIKGSWGIVGNTNVADYASKSYYSNGYYGDNGSYLLGQIADSKNLKWESSTKYDVGFSAQLLNNITVDFDYYKTVSSDLILNVPVSPSKGIPNNYITTNAGKMNNTGIELNIGADIIKTNDFTWNSSFNITTTNNKVTKLADGIDQLVSGSSTETTNITVPGKSIGQLYVYPTGGIDRETGRRIFYGKDGTKVLLMYEKDGRFFTEDGQPYAESDIEPVICGNTLPTFYGGWTNNFRYKDFDLSILFQYSGGNYIYNGTTATNSDMRYWNNTTDVLENYWTPERKDAKYAYPIYGDNYSNGSAKPISDWVEKGDYLRLKNISLGYTFSTKKWPKKLGISSLRVYAQAQNLFVITGYSGLDPEALTNNTNANLRGGTDKNTLPQAKVYTFGMNVTF
ncbi:TonB-dependent receptor [Parabacteroides sp. AF17-28]|uniref:SusC/RagA family TonB-linked outer membrane protein n=1 Tax=Parabacteroides sp. AF17-28 TaxID=2292241 RepID=UPI001F363E40|nr:TonB-dependent receptor [Parabacteroides sp. AF17-28]